MNRFQSPFDRPLSSKANTFARQPLQPLRVLVGGSIGRNLIAPALPRFLSQHPELQIHLVNRTWDSAAGV